MNDEVRFERQGATGTIWLDRPKALNALTHAMVRAMDATLADWAADPAIARVLIRSTSEKAFCAGGDVRAVRALGPGPHPDQVAFFSDEYRLNARIKHFSKPFIALIDGICMGGGVGISAHGSHRVGTEKFVFAMPEVAIGFFPDVGGGHVLSRMPSRAGLYCGLTGGRLGLADALWAGIVTHAVRTADLPAIAEALTAGAPIEETLAAAAFAPEPGPIEARADAIDRLFAADSVAGCLALLDAEAGNHADFARETAETIRARSPTSLCVTFEDIRRQAALAFDDGIRLDHRIAWRILADHDFFEGVRAVLVDRDNAPRWKPATLEEVDPVEIEAHFAVPPGGDLALP